MLLIAVPVTTSNTNALSPNAWEESTGMLSSLIPQSNGTTVTDPRSFNASKGDLKLGPLPISDDLQIEAERVLREQAMLDRDPNAQYDAHWTRPAPPAGVISPSMSDLLPHPSAFQTQDVKREVEKVRDARKRIRLEPSALTNANLNTQQGAAARSRALPSICAYTLHDVGEGYVSVNLVCSSSSHADLQNRAPCCAFSQDTSLMAAGFSESYIRLWSLKGEKITGYRSDFQSSAVKDGK